MPAETCGNAVLDTDEDCDLAADPGLGAGTRCAPPADEARACRYLCDGGARCPDGWGCAADGVCRHATGTFVEALESSIELPGDDWIAGDADGDGRTDVVALVGNGIRVAYGDSGAQLTAEVSYLSGRETSGAVTATDLDGDGRLDAIVPFPAGVVVLRGQVDRSFGAVAYSPYEIGPAPTAGVWLSAIRIPGRAPEHQLFAVSAGASFLETHVVLIPEGQDETSLPVAGPLHPIADLAARMPVADLDPPSGADEVALAFHGDSVVHVLRPTRSVFTGRFFNDEVAAVSIAPATVDRGAMFADVDGDGAIDLLVSVSDAAGDDQVYVAWNDGAGGLSVPVPQPWFDALAEPGAALPGLAEDLRRWPLAAGDLDGDGRADFVTPNGVFLNEPAGLRLTERRTTAQPWTDGLIGHLNERGVDPSAPDLALVVAGTRGVHVLLGGGDGIFNPFWLDTAGPPAHLRGGDLDGDEIGDLIFAARGVGGDGLDELTVVYGNASGGPSPASPVGRLPEVERLEVGTFRFPSIGFDHVSDVFITSAPGEDGRRPLAVFAGAPGRVLLSSFALPGPDGNDPVLMARAGRFLPRAAGDSTRDVLCLGDGADLRRLWLIRGAPGAGFERGDASAHPWADVVPAGFVADGARWTVGDLDGDGLDELIGLDAGGARLRVRAAVDAAGLVTLSAEVTALPAAAGARRVEVVDADGDGAGELLVVVADGLHMYRGDAVAPVSLAAPGLTSVAILNADADPDRELVALGAEGIAIAEIAGAGFELGALPALPGVTGDRVLVADADGDGLDDLIVAGAGRLRVFLAEPHVAAGGAP